jgi:hypothetical protein
MAVQPPVCSIGEQAGSWQTSCVALNDSRLWLSALWGGYVVGVSWACVGERAGALRARGRAGLQIPNKAVGSRAGCSKIPSMRITPSIA